MYSGSGVTGLITPAGRAPPHLFIHLYLLITARRHLTVVVLISVVLLGGQRRQRLSKVSQVLTDLSVQVYDHALHVPHYIQHHLSVFFCHSEIITCHR